MNARHDPAGKLSPAVIKQLSQKSLYPWIRDALIDWLVIGLTFWALVAAQNPWLAAPAVLILGNRQHALTVLGHEAAHFTLSESRKINDSIANLLAFWPLGLTAGGYRNVHFKHHKSTNTANDPELAHRGARAPQWDLPISPTRIARYCLSDLLGGSLADYVIIVRFSKPNHTSDYLPPLLLHVALAALCLLTGFWWIAALWYLSLVTSFMMFFRLRTCLEHLGTDGTHRLHLNWWQRHLIAPHNIWYHWEHHLYPAIAYAKLPLARRLLPQEPIISLGELLAFYKNADRIASGAVLKPGIR